MRTNLKHQQYLPGECGKLHKK